MNLPSPNIWHLAMCPLLSNLQLLSFISMSPPFAFLLSSGRLAFLFIQNPPQVILGFAGFCVCATVT